MLAVAIFGASDSTESSPPETLLVTVNVPLFGYVYVSSYEDNVKSPETATPSYVISTSPFSLSFSKNLYWSLTIIYAFLSSIVSFELKS